MPEQPAIPSPRPSAFQRAIVPVSLGLGSLAGVIWLAWALFESQREDVATARAFLTHIAAEQHAQATTLMAPELTQDVGPGGLALMFGQIEPWDHIGFSSRNTNGGGTARLTELLGVGEAVSGCQSSLRIMMIGGLIQSFNVTPLCPLAGTDV